MIGDVRELLWAERYGVLSTLSARHQGWPFGTIVPYALDDEGQPLLLLSDLAEHTRNLQADARASLLVTSQLTADGDPQAGPRVTLLGTVEIVPAHGVAAAREHYVARHPRSAEYFGMADFRLYVFRGLEARFIKGFGEMGWVNLQKESG